MYGDQGMLFRVFINLLNNAIEYGNFGGTVKVSLVRSEGRIQCCIADNGIGIAEEHLLRIWQRFYQVNPARKRTQNNMGLGLFMVKKIIDLHGGTINVSSQPGAGTEFTFTF
jgi:signal transduction histidine kinase